MSIIKHLQFFLFAIIIFQIPHASAGDLGDILVGNSQCNGKCGEKNMNCKREAIKGVRPKKGTLSQLQQNMQRCGINLGNCFESCDSKLDNDLKLYWNDLKIDTECGRSKIC